MDPEILNFERAAPCEPGQPCADSSTLVARQDGERTIIVVAGGGDVVAGQLLFDEAHIGFSRGILHDQGMLHVVIGLVVTHLASLLVILGAAFPRPANTFSVPWVAGPCL